MINIDFIIKMDIDLKNLNEDDLIKICIDKGIEYLNNKTKKIYTKSTLITRIKKFDEDNKEVKEKEEIKIDYKNEVIWTLTDEDKKNNNDYNDIESKLKNIIKSCHNYLYSNGSIVGNDASNDIITLFILKIMNYLYISNKELITEKIKDLIQNEDYPYYLTYLEDIKNICKIRDLNDINSQYEDYMDDVIRRNLLPRIFTEDKDYLLNTRSDASGICKIIGELDKIIINDITIKAFSTISIYEYFNSTYEGKTKSKKFGQFFTPRKIINAILFGCDFKKDIETFDNPTIYDPCCGTAGLLCYIYNNCSNINPTDIYGTEIHKDTIKFAVASLMLSTNSLFENLNKGCALSNNKFIFENKKFDVIFTNPPFGTQTNYKSLKSKYDYNKPKDFTINFEDIFPIITNDGINLFIQLIIYSLKDNGICAIILPDGELIYSKSLTNMRKFIIDNCKILKFISVESKAFVHTQIKTNVIILKKQKGIDNHKNIEFLELNKDCDEIKLIAIADLDEYYRFKLEVEEEKLISKNENIQIKTLGEVCKFKNGKNITKEELKIGDYPVIGGGQKPFGFHNTYNCEENTILCSSSGAYSGFISIYKTRCWASDCFSIIPINNSYLNNTYLYYYLKSIQLNIYKLQSGAAQPHLYSKNIELLEIPIPTLEIQEEIIKYLDELFENNNKETLFNYNNNKLFEWLLYNPEIKDIIKLFYEIESSNIDITNTITKLYELNKSKIKIVKFNPTTIINEFGKIFNLIKGTIQSSKVIEDKNGNCMFISKAEITEDTRNIYSDTYNINALYIAQAFNGNGKCPIRYYNMKSIHSNLLYHIKPKEAYKDKINIKYIYYYLLEKKEYIEINYQKGLANKSLDVEKFNLMKIPIPSLEVQEEIINYCDNNLEVINNLKKIIEDNNKMMKDLFS
jgi:type I restriction-modification system DNA methylase subunit